MSDGGDSSASSTQPTKRKRQSLSIEKKVEIIRKLEAGATQKNMASKYEISRNSVQTIWSDRKRLLEKPRSRYRRVGVHLVL